MIRRMVTDWLANTVQDLARLTQRETDNLLKNALDKNDGISGTFTTTDGKTVTVVNGQITNIK